MSFACCLEGRQQAKIIKNIQKPKYQKNQWVFIVFGRLLGPSWRHRGTNLGPRWPQDGPKMVQDGPKMAQDKEKEKKIRIRRERDEEKEEKRKRGRGFQKKEEKDK